jgi:hydrogenase nickel incorporation protein HypB
MCTKCGCGSRHTSGIHQHQHADGTLYFHADHAEAHAGAHHHDDNSRSSIVNLELNILAENERFAMTNRQLLQQHGIFTINLISSPGSGKTALLERTLAALNGKISCAVIVGDQRGDADAKRMLGKGAPVTQIETGDACHLNAKQVGEAIAATIQPETQLLFIENVGNLVCPASFDLGEDLKIAVLSAPEGEDKPIKYPTLFNRAQVVIISKIDLCPYLDWDIERCRGYLRQVNPEAQLFELSSRTGAGFELWINYLKQLNSNKA